MRSFGIWYRGEGVTEENPRKELTLNVNLWGTENSEKKSFYFDFGFLIENLKDIEKICLYVPFDLKKKDVEDLGKKISNEKLVSAIFNENYTITQGEAKKTTVNKKNGTPFVIYHLNVEEQVELQEVSRDNGTLGTILSIDTTEIPREEPYLEYYFRIRIKIDSESIHFIADKIKGKNILKSSFFKTEIIDFRINDIRSCSENIREKFSKENKFLIKKIHYLILRNASDTVIYYGKPMGTRLLEEDLWKGYIENIDGDIVAYHIKAKVEDGGEVDTFSELVRFQYEVMPKKTIIGYVIITIIIGLLVNSIFQFIVDSFSKTP